MGTSRVLIALLGLLLAGCSSLTSITTPTPTATHVPPPVAVEPASPTLAVVESTPTPDMVMVVCKCKSLNIRSKPGDDIAAVGWLDAGAAVRVTGKRSGSWVEITSGGWVHGGYLCQP